MNIINPSSYTLINFETTLLSKGLEFCPTATLDTFYLIKDLQMFSRKLTLKSMYNKQEQNHTQLKNKEEQKAIDQLISLLEESDQTYLIDCVNVEQLLQKCGQPMDPPPPLGSVPKIKSDRFPPPSTNPNVVTFLRFLAKDIDKLPTQSKCKQNLANDEQLSFKDLANNFSLIIKQSGKGGKIVIMDNN